jgi:hypothetical protein
VTLTSTLASLIFVFLLHIRKTGKNQWNGGTGYFQNRKSFGTEGQCWWKNLYLTFI